MLGLCFLMNCFEGNVVNLFSSLYNNSFVPLVDTFAFGHQNTLLP